jgi:hypothetical protein
MLINNKKLDKVNNNNFLLIVMSWENYLKIEMRSGRSERKSSGTQFHWEEENKGIQVSYGDICSARFIWTTKM